MIYSNILCNIESSVTFKKVLVKKYGKIKQAQVFYKTLLCDRAKGSGKSCQGC